MKRMISLILALCMVLSLLPGTTLAVDTVTVTAEVPSDWTAAYCFSWVNGVGATNWPGVAMTKSGDVWTTEIPADCDRVIINNGSGVQTIDLVITPGEDAHIILGDTVNGKYKATVYQGDDPIQDDENTSVPDGQYVIVCDSYDVALSSVYDGYYNSAIDVSVENGALTGYGDTEIWTITNNADGTIYISINGQNLSMGDQFSSMPLDDKNDKWILEDAGNGLVYIKNVARERYMEYYAQKNNWDGYMIKADTENQFAIRLHSIECDYYVTGSSDVFSNWSECNQDGKMTQQDGIYIKKFYGVPMGDYEIKVNIGTWNNSWGDDSDDSGNYCFDVPWNDATVIVQFDPATETISVEVRSPVVAQVPELSDGYYGIYNADQLYWFAEQVNSGNTAINGKLMADIVVNENVLTAVGTLNGDGSNFRVWTPIGNDSFNYAGTFDGNGKMVSGLYLDVYVDAIGLFGYLEESGIVTNISVADTYIRGREKVGALVGYNKGSVENCHNKGMISGASAIGGIAGYNSGSIKNCSNGGAVATNNTGGGSCYGGIAGVNYGLVENCTNSGGVFSGPLTIMFTCGAGGVVGCNYGTIRECCNSGGVYATDLYYAEVGGIAGVNAGEISNCYNTGRASGAGWFVGGVAGSNTGTINDSYNTGTICGSSFVGGVVGSNDGSVSNCYYLSGCVFNDNNDGTAVTAEQFASGEVAYLLQGEQTEQVWGQDIGIEQYPVLGGRKVYHNQLSNCLGQAYYEYDNWKSSQTNVHKWDWSVPVLPTCTEPGLGTYACVICGAIKETEEISAIGHSYHNEVTSQPTCTEYGVVTHTCTICGDTYSDSVMDNLDQVFNNEALQIFDVTDQYTWFLVDDVWRSINPASYYCWMMECDCITELPADEFEAMLDKYIALNNDLVARVREEWGAYNPDNNTYFFYHGGMGGFVFERAYMGYVDNGDTYTVFFENRVLEGLTAEGYDYLETLGSYPSEITFDGKVYEHLGCGEYYHTVSYTGTGNRYEVEYDGNIVRILSWDTYGPEDKPAEFDQGVYPNLNPTGHSWTDATCTAPKTCTGCGLTEGDALGHNWRAANCTKPSTCITCGATTGNPLGHQWAEATCTAPKTCTYCGRTSGSALGHNEVVIPGYAATCQAPGMTDGTYCDRCGITLVQQLPIAPLNEEITFSYQAYGINGSTNAVNSGYITVEIWMNVNSDIARVWGTDIDLQFNENLTLLSVVGGTFQQSLSTPLSIANRDKAVKLTQDMGYSGDKTFQKGQYLFATLTFKVDKAFYGQEASFIVNLDECAVARDTYANTLNADFGTGTAIHIAMLGDANQDGKITTADAKLLSQWFAAADLDAYHTVFDLNKDGFVDGDDFALLRGAIVRDNSYLDT